MAKAPKKNGKEKATSPKKKVEKGNVKQSLMKAAKSASSSPSTPSRQQHSHFLTYLKATIKSKDVTAARQADEINKHYHTLTMEEKRTMISDFFRQGGRKSGLTSCFSQVVQNQQKADDKSWSGYLTISQLMTKWGVIGPKSQRVKTWHSNAEPPKKERGKTWHINEGILTQRLRATQKGEGENMTQKWRDPSSEAQKTHLPHSHQTSLQVTEESFTDLDELHQWAKDKFDACSHPDYPDHEHANWRLVERYYIEDRGRELSTSTTITEGLERQATDTSAALALHNMEESGQRKGPGLAELHKKAWNKLQQGLSRLTKAIGQCEQEMPSLKRKLLATEYNNIKAGLGLCRDLKDATLDQAEDHRQTPTSPDDLEKGIEVLNKLSTALTEHLQSLKEAMQQHKLVVKRDVDAAGLCQTSPIRNWKNHHHHPKKMLALREVKKSWA